MRPGIAARMSSCGLAADLTALKGAVRRGWLEEQVGSLCTSGSSEMSCCGACTTGAEKYSTIVVAMLE